MTQDGSTPAPDGDEDASAPGGEDDAPIPGERDDAPGPDEGDDRPTRPDGGSGLAQSFYGRWADLYDVIATRTPGVPAVRRRAVAALELEAGDTVVEMGCGTGANLPYLRAAVGPDGTVVGIDFTGPVLERARERTADYGNVHTVRADATLAPIRSRDPGVGDGIARSLDEATNGSADAVLATFVVGMLDDPAGAVDDWCDLVGSGGNVVLVNAARSEAWYAPPVDAVFRAVVVLSTPPTTKLRYADDPVRRLDERVRSAHDRLRARSSATADSRHLFGVVRLLGGRIA